MSSRNSQLWQIIKRAIEEATDVGETTTTVLADKIFVQLNNIVERSEKEYTIGVLSDVITRLRQ